MRLMQGAVSRDRKQNQAKQITSIKTQSKLVKQPEYNPKGISLKSKMATSFQASAIIEPITCNGLAKFRGRLKQFPYQTAK